MTQKKFLQAWEVHSIFLVTEFAYIHFGFTNDAMYFLKVTLQINRIETRFISRLKMLQTKLCVCPSPIVALVIFTSLFHRTCNLDALLNLKIRKFWLLFPVACVYFVLTLHSLAIKLNYWRFRYHFWYLPCQKKKRFNLNKNSTHSLMPTILSMMWDAIFVCKYKSFPNSAGFLIWKGFYFCATFTTAHIKSFWWWL